MPLVKRTWTRNLAKVDKSLGHWKLTARWGGCGGDLKVAAKLGHLFTSAGIDGL